MSELRCFEKEYKDVRQHKDNYPDWFVGCYGFLTTFGSKWFGGWGRRSKAKTGEVWNASIPNFASESPLLQNIEFVCSDYTQHKYPQEYCVIYCDPPYKGTTAYNTKFDHKKFYDWCRSMSKKNKLFISEYSMPSDFQCIFEYSFACDLAHNTERERVERLFTI